MKRKIIASVVLWMSALSIFAGVRVGVKAGVNLANAVTNTDAITTNNFTGFQVGPMMEISGLTGWGVDFAILYSQHGMNFRALSPLNTATNYEKTVSTLDIPLNLKFKFSIAKMCGFYLTAGPYINFNVDDQTNFTQIKTDWQNNHFGTGLNFGAGFEVLKHLQIGANYQLALNDDYSKFINFENIIHSDFKAKSRIWSITAAILF